MKRHGCVSCLPSTQPSTWLLLLWGGGRIMFANSLWSIIIIRWLGTVGRLQARSSPCAHWRGLPAWSLHVPSRTRSSISFSGFLIRRHVQELIYVRYVYGCWVRKIKKFYLQMPVAFRIFLAMSMVTCKGENQRKVPISTSTSILYTTIKVDRIHQVDNLTVVLVSSCIGPRCSKFSV
jgi:hypothetical protein